MADVPRRFAETGAVSDAEGAAARLERRIAELERACAEARDASAARATFLATMSHELREPMNGVLGMARLLRETPLDDEQCGYVDAVVSSAEALISVVNDILDLSRIDAGRLDFDAVDFALRPFFQRLGALLASRAARKGIGFRIDLPADLVAVVNGDPGRLRQMLINLAGNAIKFTSEGEVVIAVRQGSSDDRHIHLQLSVSDTGAGIPLAIQRNLFSAFAQADAGVPRVFGGSGLGLMIAQRLAQAMDGTIDVSSDGVRGSRFDVRVRLAAAQDTAEAMAVRRADLAGATLLVIDGQERSRATVEQLARLWHMHARGAASAREGLAVLEDAIDRDAPFDFVVIDRSLCDEAGDELGAHIRGMHGTAHTRLVLLVASGMRGDAARAREAGFDAYLPKPLTASTLLDCLQQLRAGAKSEDIVTIHSIGDQKRPALQILVADDNPVNRKVTSIMLGRAGHEVTTAEDGAEAVALLEKSAFDLVLMDVQMPVLDGLSATRRIRALADRRRAATPVVAITANAMQGDDRACFAAGMTGYVSKPVDRASLLRAVDEALATRAA
ncbi:MAG: response regulator [Geminicoccaceae bacterium]|nr:response regulator [Geminicoccaceae bacterium]